MAVEEFRHDKVKESPQLCHCVLDGCASEKESVSGVELEQNLPSPTQVILNGLGFIQDHVMPLHSDQLHLILRIVHDQVVGGHQYIYLHARVVKVLWIQESSQFLPLLRTPEVRKHFQGGTELLELILPVV